MASPADAPLTLRQSLWLLATGITAFLPLAPQVPAWLALATAALFAWRGALAWFCRALPKRWFLAVISLSGMAGTLLEYRTIFGQRAGVALLVILLALKQLEARAPRDGLAIVLLAYFLTLAQFFENQSIPVALGMIVTVVVATAALASLSDATARASAMFRLSGALLLQSLPFMLILFILFPRVSGPLWGLPTDAYSGMTGLSGTMNPGSINNLTQSQAIAFRVKFNGPPPTKREMYWRGPVLTRIDANTWHPGKWRPLEQPAYRAQADSPRYRYTLTLEAHNKHWIFALERPLVRPPQSFFTDDFQLHAAMPVRDRQRYELESHTQIEYDMEDLDTLAATLALPERLNPRTVAQGARLRADHAEAEARVEAAVRFLRDQRLTYTLRPPLMSVHVADDFLFTARRGFCEHFSAAFAILMRSAGIPARVVTGYQGGEHNPVDDTWVIRQSDAHAWTEVWLDQRGWVRIDPTAVSMPARIEENLAAAVPEGDPLPLQFEFLNELRYHWWAASNAWNQWVLGYDPQRQRDFLMRLGMNAPDWRSMTALLAVFSGLVLIGLLVGLLYRRPRLDPAQKLWRRFAGKLARRGLGRNPWEGPQTYAQRCGEALPEKAGEIAAISELYAGLRYGKSLPSDLQQLRCRIAAFRP